MVIVKTFLDLEYRNDHKIAWLCVGVHHLPLKNSRTKARGEIIEFVESKHKSTKIFNYMDHHFINNNKTNKNSLEVKSILRNKLIEIAEKDIVENYIETMPAPDVSVDAIPNDYPSSPPEALRFSL